MSTDEPTARDLERLMANLRAAGQPEETSNGAAPVPVFQPAPPAPRAHGKPSNPAPKSRLVFGRDIRAEFSRAESGRAKSHRNVAPEHVDSLVIEQMSDVVPYSVQWLWPGRIPLGRLTLLAGDPGVGKSQAVLDMAARVSRGAAWPDKVPATCKPANVIVFSMEDDLRETVAPRLIAAGASAEFRQRQFSGPANPSDSLRKEKAERARVGPGRCPIRPLHLKPLSCASARGMRDIFDMFDIFVENPEEFQQIMRCRFGQS
jgi:hypothetical protein